MKKILVLSSGSMHGGGTTLSLLLNKVRTGEIPVSVEAIVTHFADGGVARIAKQNDIQLYVADMLFSKTQMYEFFANIMLDVAPDYVFVLGWNTPVAGIGRPVISVHHGPLPQTEDCASDAIHVKVKELGLTQSCFVVHYVDPDGARGPHIYTSPWIPVKNKDAKTIGTLVRESAAEIVPIILNLVVTEHIKRKNGTTYMDVYAQQKLHPFAIQQQRRVDEDNSEAE